MAHQNTKSLADFVPRLQQPTLPAFRDSKQGQNGISSLIKLTEPHSTASSISEKGQISWKYSQTPSLANSRRDDGNNSKKLKLKDYLHLNSIEKKSKKSNSSTKLQPDQSTSIQLKKSVHQVSTVSSQKLRQSTVLSESPMPLESTDPTEILKEDILKRIEYQIRELDDLAKYVKSDFKIHESQSKGQFLLFNILNSVVGGSKTYQQIGDQIVEYENRNESNKQKDKEYYWHERRKELESPAKMLKRGLELTYSVSETLTKKN